MVCKECEDDGRYDYEVVEGWGNLPDDWGLVDIVWGGCMMLGLAGIMLVLNTRIALVVLSVMPILVAISFYFQRRILEHNREVRKTNSRISGTASPRMLAS